MDYIPMNMMREMDYFEMVTTISKVWIDVDDIMSLAQCGKNSAINIRKAIETQIMESGKKLPVASRKCVPTKLVLEYLGLDADYIFNMAERLA